MGTGAPATCTYASLVCIQHLQAKRKVSRFGNSDNMALRASSMTPAHICTHSAFTTGRHPAGSLMLPYVGRSGIR